MIVEGMRGVVGPNWEYWEPVGGYWEPVGGYWEAMGGYWEPRGAAGASQCSQFDSSSTGFSPRGGRGGGRGGGSFRGGRGEWDPPSAPSKASPA